MTFHCEDTEAVSDGEAPRMWVACWLSTNSEDGTPAPLTRTWVDAQQEEEA